MIVCGRSAPSFVGRERELDLLIETVTRPPAVAIVEGEAGIGKTRLVREALASPALSRRRRLVGRCRPVHGGFPFGAFVEALRGLDCELLSGSLSPVVGALAPLLPELAPQLPPCPELSANPLVMRHRTFRAFQELLGALAPAVLVVEDLHWADQSSVELLELLLSTPPAGLALILTFRRQELDAGTPTLALAARVPGNVPREMISLSVLNQEEVRDLAGAILTPGEVSEQLVHDLHGRTAGLPFALEEVIQSLRDREQLVFREGRWRCGELGSLDVPPAIGDSVRQRLARLGADARRIAEAVTVLGAPAAEEPIGKVARLLPSRSRAGLSLALASGLVQEVEEGLFGLRHPLAEQAVYEGIPSPQRRTLHLRAARVLEADREPDSLVRIAVHFKKAGRVRLWLRYAEQAATAAASIGDDRGAASLLVEALSTPVLPIAARARMAAQLGHAAHFARTPGHAIATLEDIVEEKSLRSGIRGELRFCLARLFYQLGDSTRGHQEMVRSAGELRWRPALAARAMSDLAATWRTDGGTDDRRSWLDRALEAERRQHDPAVTTHVLASRAIVLLEQGDPAGWRASEDLPWRTHSIEQAVELVRACKYLAATATLLGHYGRAEGFIEKATKIRGEIGNQRFGVGLATAESELQLTTGRWRGLEARARRLLEASAEALIMGGRNELILGWLLLSRGELEQAEGFLMTALGAFRNARSGSFLLTVTAGLMRLHLARGDTGVARAMASLALEAIQTGRIWTLSQAVPPMIVEVFLACKEHADAHTVATELAEGLRGRDAPAGHASLAVCRGLLAEAEGHRRIAARWFTRAERAWSVLPCPYEAARARERRGACLLAIRDSAGEDCLFDALEQFEALGASWDSARTRALLRAHDVPLRYPWRGGRRGYRQELSPREREVAELAGTGRTSPEIAQALFLSPRTVESHVASAMRKLEVESRQGLGHALKSPPAARPPEPSKIP